MRRRTSGFAPFATPRTPVIRWGQSNIASRYEAATLWPARQQGIQDALLVSHTVTVGPYTTERATWERMQPQMVGTPPSGSTMGHWGLDLADPITALGIPIAMIDYCIGGTNLAYWTPGQIGSEYATALAWTQARLAELAVFAPYKEPIFLFDQGESGLGGDIASWAAGFAEIASALRAALGFATMPIVIQQVPENSYYHSATINASKVAYAASDARCLISYVKQQTYIAGTPLIHIDSIGGRLLAVGPDSANCKSYLTCIKALWGMA